MAAMNQPAPGGSQKDDMAERRHENTTGPAVGRRQLLGGSAGMALLGSVGSAFAFADYPITPGQRQTAQRVAQRGVPLEELSPDAPDRYTIKRGDTLWAISGLYLRQPWRWPVLWGMNLQQIRNPHLIFPGQVLALNQADGRAWLSFDPGAAPAVKLSPRVRRESLDEVAIPPIPLGAIAPFLNEALVVEESALARAARIVATPENRVLLSQGDRAYARGQYGEAGALSGSPLLLGAGPRRQFRVFRNATPLRDPASGEILGHEAQYVGKAVLERSEQTETGAEGKAGQQIVPATIDITQTREEIRIGDRLLPEPPRELPTFIPHAPDPAQQGRVVSVYGNAVRFAGQHQVIAVNRGSRDGLERGHVLALLRDSGVQRDKTDETRPELRLPAERNGLTMVFRTFERVSYALVLQITDGVKVGDRFGNP